MMQNWFKAIGIGIVVMSGILLAVVGLGYLCESHPLGFIGIISFAVFCIIVFTIKEMLDA